LRVKGPARGTRLRVVSLREPHRDSAVRARSTGRITETEVTFIAIGSNGVKRFYGNILMLSLRTLSGRKVSDNYGIRRVKRGR
jgi:hypothetical protein